MVLLKYLVFIVIFFNLNLNVFLLFKEDFFVLINFNFDRIYDIFFFVNKVLKLVKFINYKLVNYKLICLFKLFKDKFVFYFIKCLFVVLFDEKILEINIFLKYLVMVWLFFLSIYDIFINIIKLCRLLNVSIIFNVKFNFGVWKWC